MEPAGSDLSGKDVATCGTRDPRARGCPRRSNPEPKEGGRKKRQRHGVHSRPEAGKVHSPAMACEPCLCPCCTNKSVPWPFTPCRRTMGLGHLEEPSLEADPYSEGMAGWTCCPANSQCLSPCFQLDVSREPSPAPGHGEMRSIRKRLERGGMRKKLCFVGTTLCPKKKTEPVSQPRCICAGRK